MSGEDSKRQRISVEMSEPMVALIDQLKGEYGARSRGRVLEMLLQDLLDPGDAVSDPEVDPLKGDAEPAVFLSLIHISEPTRRS